MTEPYLFDVHENGATVPSFSDSSCLGAILAIALNGRVVYRVRVTQRRCA